MEEEKAAAYYDELSRKGEGAAKFKQGLGFSSSSNGQPKPRATPSSIFSNFVRASSPGKSAEIQKEAPLQSIRDKLKKQRPCSPNSRERNDLYSDRSKQRSLSRERSGRRERDGERLNHRHRSRSRERYGRRRRERERSQSNSRSRSPSRVLPGGNRDRGHKRERERERGSPQRRHERSRSNSRSRSPSRVWPGGNRDRGHKRERGKERERGSPQRRHESSRSKSNSTSIDYSTLIEGYSQMTSGERIRAKTQLQLSQTAAKDKTMSMGTGWERFDFNKDAPLDDDDDEIEVAEDDASLVRDIGQSFRFTAVQAKREEHVKAAHDQAMFGVPAASPDHPETEPIEKYEPKERKTENLDNDLVSDKVIALQQGSWRDRARNVKPD